MIFLISNISFYTQEKNKVKMNIFVLHPNPSKAARWHADKHVVKMILESVQMLYSAHWVSAYPFLLGAKGPFAVSTLQKNLEDPPSFKELNTPFQLKNPKQRGYRPVHLHHPCTVWVRSSLQNYIWLCRLALCLILEHAHRWPDSPPHSCMNHAIWLIENPPNLPDIPLTPFAVAMPDEYKKGDPIKSYRAFYSGSKTDRGITNRYTKRHKPHWLTK